MQPFPFRVIDLTHPVHAGMPLWPGDPETVRTDHASHDEYGYALNTWTIGEHSGTHVGTPEHRVPGGQTMDQVPVNDLVLPFRMIDTSGSISVAELERNEAEHGRIQAGCCVALRTGWDVHWPEPSRVFERGPDGGFVWPGFTPDAVEWLHRERQVRVIATDAPDIGPGVDEELVCGRRCAELGMLHVENLASLDQMPASGGFVVIGAMSLVGGTGSPARVFGLVPQSK